MSPPTEPCPDAGVLDDQALVRAYQQCDEDAGEPWCDALAAELERRCLDF